MPKYNCSFHGIVEEVPGISVDNFSNIGSKFRAYFLSHCHTDHASGIDGIPLLEHLQKTQTTYIYMSKLTAAIIEDEAFKFSNLDDDVRMQHVKSLMNYIKVLDLGHNSITLKAVPEEGLEQLTVAVELITAGHSLGSVMFLFQTYAKTVLFTGDFRISVNDVAKYKQFHDQNGDPIHIDKMYIDTTFAEPRYEYFPKRSQSIDFAIGKIRQHINKSEENIVVLETSARYTYEYVFNEIYRQLGLKVSVSKDQWRFYSKFPTEIPGVTDSCSRILLASKGNTYSSNGNQLTLKLSAMRWSSYQEDDETYHGDGNCLYVCFATHCSFNEVRYFINYFSPQSVEMFPIRYEVNSPFIVQTKSNEFSLTPKKRKADNKCKTLKKIDPEIKKLLLDF